MVEQPTIIAPELNKSLSINDYFVNLANNNNEVHKVLYMDEGFVFPVDNDFQIKKISSMNEIKKIS